MQARPPAALAAALLLVGCYALNPGYEPPSATDGASTTAAVTAAATAGASASASASESSSAAATAGADASAADATGTTVPTGATDIDTADTAVTTDTSGTTDTTDTTDTADTADTADTDPDGLTPGLHTLPVALAACVFLDNGAGYGPPPVCAQNATAQNATALEGLLYIDTQVQNLDGFNRPAHTFLRFDLPVLAPGAALAAATLRLQIADGSAAAGPQSGTVVLAQPFTEVTLASAAPGVGAALAGDPGPSAINQLLAWTLPVDSLTPGQPLYLALLPKDNDGVIYRGQAGPGAPTLELIVQ